VSLKIPINAQFKQIDLTQAANDYFSARSFPSERAPSNMSDMRYHLPCMRAPPSAPSLNMINDPRTRTTRTRTTKWSIFQCVVPDNIHVREML
jgi:hypothetical protein